MTIQEAIKSGRKFRRPGDRGWFDPSLETFRFSYIYGHEILADDWEIEAEEEKIEIAKHQLIDAFYKAQSSTHANVSYRTASPHLNQQSLPLAMAKELGFK